MLWLDREWSAHCLARRTGAEIGMETVGGIAGKCHGTDGPTFPADQHPHRFPFATSSRCGSVRPYETEGSRSHMICVAGWIAIGTYSTTWTRDVRHLDLFEKAPLLRQVVHRRCVPQCREHDSVGRSPTRFPAFSGSGQFGWQTLCGRKQPAHARETGARAWHTEPNGEPRPRRIYGGGFDITHSCYSPDVIEVIPPGDDNTARPPSIRRWWPIGRKREHVNHSIPHSRSGSCPISSVSPRRWPRILLIAPDVGTDRRPVLLFQRD